MKLCYRLIYLFLFKLKHKKNNKSITIFVMSVLKLNNDWIIFMRYGFTVLKYNNNNKKNNGYLIYFNFSFFVIEYFI